MFLIIEERHIRAIYEEIKGYAHEETKGYADSGPLGLSAPEALRSCLFEAISCWG